MSDENIDPEVVTPPVDAPETPAPAVEESTIPAAPDASGEVVG